MYAVIEASSDLSTMLYIISGSVEQLCSRIIAECDALMEAFAVHHTPDPNLYCDFSSYQLLRREPTAKNLLAFTFDISDCRTDVVALASDFDDLAAQFEEFKMGYGTLCEWRMLPPETENAQTLEELSNELCFLSQGEMRSYSYFEEVDE